MAAESTTQEITQSQPGPVLKYQGEANPSKSEKPTIAVVCNSLPPYRLNVHQRIAREIPEVWLRTVMTHEDDRWPLVAPPEIGLAMFGEGEPCWDQNRLRFALHEWKKAGRIIRWAEAEKVSAMVMLGYSDAGRVRLIAWCRRRRVACFVWGDSNIRDESVSGLKAVVKMVLVSRVLGWATGILTCGRLGRDFFAKYGVPRDRMFSFPVEPDYDLIRNLPPERVEEVRRSMQMADGRRRIVFSGRLSPEKRVDLLIDAFARLAADRPEWDLYIVGDGALRPQLDARVPAGLEGRVIWTGHLSDQATLSAVYRASDVLVLPSDQERWSLVIIEAATAGMAIVSSDVPGASAELVRDRENGRIFPAGNLAALTECLLDVTRAENIETMKGRSLALLADWRKSADPIRGLREALRFAGLLR